MGLPVTSLMESAAPPRASPSSLVRMKPSSVEPPVELGGRAHRVLANHRVADEEDVVRLDVRP